MCIRDRLWAAQYYNYTAPGPFLTSGGLGTMGYGLGAAMGAKCGRPEKTVINVAGDGCFRMNMNEIATLVRSNIPVIEVVINNHVLGMVRQWQTLFYGKRYSHTILELSLIHISTSKSSLTLDSRRCFSSSSDMSELSAAFMADPIAANR